MSNWWFSKLWKWHIPQKLKCFCWILLKDKLLTCQKLIKRGWMGPGYCAMCMNESDCVNHIFIHCSFSKSVWKLACEGLKVYTPWWDSNIEENFRIWHQEEGTYKLLPIFYQLGSVEYED